jgi:branched-subunit amino acid aminotransferase/4-amino-4-deoxychorismate lyase
MSTPTAPTSAVYRWHDGALQLLDYCDMAETTVEAADSWLVSDGRTLALDVHRSRFLAAAGIRADAPAFWDAAIAAIPREGEWFPRVELQSRSGAPVFVFRLRSAPTLSRSVVVATHSGPDPRTRPTVKGPDLEAMLRIRTAVQPLGAEEAVILSPDGYVVEGAYSAIVWWRGAILCAPAPDLERIDSVTARSLLGMAAALGVETYEEAVTPAELDGCEVWALSALHGPRIITKWVDGPDMAALPGRLDLWRTRLAVLRRELPA